MVASASRITFVAADVPDSSAGPATAATLATITTSDTIHRQSLDMASVDFRVGYGCGSFEKIEITTLVGLRDMLRENLAVAAVVFPGFRFPGRAALFEFHLGDLQRQLPARHVELDDVAGFHQRKRPADPRLWRYMQHAGTVTGAAHARIRNAHHVAHALLEQLLRD